MTSCASLPSSCHPLILSFAIVRPERRLNTRGRIQSLCGGAIMPARPLYRLVVLAAALPLPTFVHAADTPPATRPARQLRPGAGGPRDPGQMLKMQRQRLDELNLSDEQK